MTETLFRMNLKEISAIRVRCNHCNVATDYPVGALGQLYRCHACHRDFVLTPEEINRADRFGALADAIRRLVEVSHNVSVEFVTPITVKLDMPPN